MQEMGSPNDGFGPLGICHRLYNFIMNTFLTRGTRRITLGTSNEASYLDDESRALQDTKPNHGLISPNGHDTKTELPVEFRHKNGGGIVNRSRNGSSQVFIHENGKPTKTHKKNDQQDRSNGNGGREKVPKRSTVTIAEGGNLPGRRHHLLNVTSNINEKADAFIRSKKESMEKNLSMKQTGDV